MADTPVPDGLAVAGTALWSAVTEVLDLDEHELILLRELARCADTLDELHAKVESDGLLVKSPQGVKTNPALVEERAQRIVFARLMTAMQLPTGITTVAEAGGKRGQRRPGIKGVYSIAGGRG